MLKPDKTGYEKENQRELLFMFGIFLTVGVFHSAGPVKIVFSGDSTWSFTMDLIFGIGFTVSALKGIWDILRRKREISRLISGGKYLIGHLDSVGEPEHMLSGIGFKNGLFSCIDETGKRYCVQSEPFHPSKIPFDKETPVKIYADSMTAPKITYVSAEKYYDGEISAENDTDGRVL